MNPATRNTLVLAVFWAAILGVAWGVVGTRQRGDLKSWREREKALDAELSRLERGTANFDADEVLATADQAREEVMAVMERKSDEPIYQYLRSLLEAEARGIKFTFRDLKEGSPDKASVRRYSVKGEGTTSAVYRFLWAVESKDRLIEVESLRLRELVGEGTEGETAISFDIILSSHQLDDGRPVFLPASQVRTAGDPTLPYDPFQALRRESLPPNTQNLLEVDRATLRAITPEVAYFKDQKGNLRALKQGDAVYLGYLTQLEHDRNRVQFTLNKGGNVERVTVGLELKD